MQSQKKHFAKNLRTPRKISEQRRPALRLPIEVEDNYGDVIVWLALASGTLFQDGLSGRIQQHERVLACTNADTHGTQERAHGHSMYTHSDIRPLPPMTLIRTLESRSCFPPPSNIPG